jgi:hypothetical protein
MITPQTLRPLAALALSAMLLAPQVARAEMPASSPASGHLSASAGIDVASRYYFRGIVQERSGAIIQPMVELRASLLEGEGALRELALTTGLWTSLHSRNPAVDTGPSPWYEADFYVGLSAGLSGGLEIGASYTAYASPNGSFGTVHELGIALAFDDAPLWTSVFGERFSGLAPSAGVAFELSNTAFGDAEGIYLELGLAPSLSVFTSPGLALAAAVPLTLGLSARDYYTSEAGQNSPFGYVDAGLALSAELSFIPARYGSWELGLAGHVLVLGEATGGLARAAGGDELELLTVASLAIAF